MATTPKRGRGRSPSKYVEVKAMLTPMQIKHLDQLAAKHKVARAAALRLAMDDFVGTVPVRGTSAGVPAEPLDMLALMEKLEARITRIEARAKGK